MNTPKLKLLFWGDSPTAPTGFGTVSKNILKRLHATGMYDITVVGINFYGKPSNLPYEMYPACYGYQNNDIYGRQMLLDLLRSKSNHFDVLFTLQDTFIVSTIGDKIKELRDGIQKFSDEVIDGERVKRDISTKGKGFKWIYYFPIDGTPKKEWLEKSVALCDIAVPYTEYAKNECQKLINRSYEVIYHGFDKDTFFPMEEAQKQEFRDKYFSANELGKKFVIVNVNRNQQRKGLFQTLLAFKIFNTLVPNSILYTHCDVEGDVGGNLLEVAKQINLKSNWIYPNPAIFKSPDPHIPVEFVNGIYNIADVNISTSYGEGFGLSLIEAMAAKTINVFPDNTSIKELLADGRGILVKSGNTANNLIMNGHLDNNFVRPVTDVDDLVNKLLYVFRSPEKKKEIEEKAYKWAQENCDWDLIAKKFHLLITTK